MVWRAIAPEAVEIEEHHGIEGARIRASHEALELRTRHEQRTGHAIIGVDVAVIEGPTFRADEGTGPLDLAGHGAVLLRHAVLAGSIFLRTLRL